MSRFVYVVCWGEHGDQLCCFMLVMILMGVDDYY